MATKETPRTQTSAPVKPSGRAREPSPRREPDEEGTPVRRTGEEEVRGDRMPKGADEPGAGL